MNKKLFFVAALFMVVSHRQVVFAQAIDLQEGENTVKCPTCSDSDNEEEGEKKVSAQELKKAKKVAARLRWQLTKERKTSKAKTAQAEAQKAKAQAETVRARAEAKKVQAEAETSKAKIGAKTNRLRVERDAVLGGKAINAAEGNGHVRTGIFSFGDAFFLETRPSGSPMIPAPTITKEEKSSGTWMGWALSTLAGAGLGAAAGCGIGGLAMPEKIGGGEFSRSGCGYGSLIGMAGGAVIGAISYAIFK